VTTTRPCEVLLVDDEVEYLETLVKRLTRRGLDATAVHSAADALSRLRDFSDPVYLHQVKARDRENRIVGFRDLPQALADAGAREAREWRVHFHVPLFFEADGELASTAGLLDRRFLQRIDAASVAHLEIETYTFDVLPEALRSDDVTDCIEHEFRWFMARYMDALPDGR